MKIRIFAFVFIQMTIALGLALNSGAVDVLSLREPPACKSWRSIPLNEKNWVSVYDGFGQIRFDKGIHLQPRKVASADKTHAALALLRDSQGMKNFELRVVYENKQALRGPASQPWEVFWLFFNYQADGTHKKTNYLIFKPNGMELGKAWGDVHQEFLETTPSPQAQWGETYELTVSKKDSSIKAFINGHGVLDFHSTKEKLLFDQEGQIGLYTEDAAVHVKSVEICDSL